MPNRAAIRWMVTLIPVALLCCLPLAAENWPRYRGSAGDGRSIEKGLASDWPEAGLPQRWSAELGAGYSGISVVDGQLFTMFAIGNDAFATALDAASGKQIWRTRIDKTFKNNFGDGPRATPTVDDGLVYSVSSGGKLHALKAADGSVVWSKDYVRDYDSQRPEWGFANSPVVEGDLLVTDVGGGDGKLIVAFDKKSGEERWRVGNGRSGYSAPIAIEVGDVRQLVFFTAKKVVAVSPAGKLLWEQSWETSYDVNATTPIFIAPDRLFISTGYDVGASMYRIAAEGLTELWKNREMRNKFQSSVYHDGHIYGFDEKALKCIDAETGASLWSTRGVGHGSLIFADGKLIALGDQGTLLMAEASPAEYREMGRAQIFEGKSWTVPTLASGRLYLRDEKQIVAFDLPR